VARRFAVRGWNGDQASPAGDLNRLPGGIRARHGGVRVVLAGHSMGARAAFRAAGHPAVCAVAGLAPWLPPGEPAGQLAGRRVLLAHGSAGTVTRPGGTWAYAGRARAVTSVTALEVRGGDHPVLRRAMLWHAIAAGFARAARRTRAGRGCPPGGRGGRGRVGQAGLDARVIVRFTLAIDPVRGSLRRSGRAQLRGSAALRDRGQRGLPSRAFAGGDPRPSCRSGGARRVAAQHPDPQLDVAFRAVRPGFGGHALHWPHVLNRQNIRRSVRAVRVTVPATGVVRI
jgi:hypothetical protein